MAKEVSKQVKSNLLIGVKLNSASEIAKIKTTDIVVLDVNEIALGNFDESGQIALYAERSDKIREAVIYGYYDDDLELHEVNPLRLIAFTNDKVDANAKKLVEGYFYDLTHAKQTQDKVRELLIKIRQSQEKATKNYEETVKNLKPEV
ncbi:hypothetical protein EQG49_06410 [Periweissella cryptocerci]|uniref:Uncharacterized protein n=1 Tax=Periweissella cryptocerci TaxID=2506420 RepID=A0A4V1AIN4_9LACO|nr:hypothetical protein [Periweissella cryptocerci]QBO36115.1 hypothetical protein EQG49_06410 [Periweissella cryptocerci]